MKQLRWLYVVGIVLCLVLNGCGAKDGDQSLPVTQADLEAAVEVSPSLESIAKTLAGLSVEDDGTNQELMEIVTIKIGMLDMSDEDQLAEVAAELQELMFANLNVKSIAPENIVLRAFSDFLNNVLTGGQLEVAAAEPKSLSLEGVGARVLKIVVADGATAENHIKGGGYKHEILPNANVYALPKLAGEGLLAHILAPKVTDADVQFFVVWNGEEHLLGEAKTDKGGKASLEKLAALLPEDVFDDEQKDLVLRARLVAEGYEDVVGEAIVRVLAMDKKKNRKVILTDHDNTLHETGGKNALIDIISALNSVREEWPLVDHTAAEVVGTWLVGKDLDDPSDDSDMIIISGMSEHMRAKTRDQMQLHFAGAGSVLTLVKHDMPYEHSEEFKPEAIAIFCELYGKDNVVGMVGDTVRQDGLGARANDVPYAAFQIHHELMPSLLEIGGGYDETQPVLAKDICWTWEEVMVWLGLAEEGLEAANVWLTDYSVGGKYPMNIAHRGGGLLKPEDTLEAYRYAIKMGADAIEGDCHMTKDGYMVISHDATVDRCTNGSGPITEYYLADLQALNAGWNFKENGKYPYRDGTYAPVSIPTVEDVLKMLVDEFPEIPMILEIKSAENRDEAVDKVLELIATYDGGTGQLINRLQMGAFNQEALDLIKQKGQERNMDLVRCYSIDGVLDFLGSTVEDLMAPDQLGEVLALPWAISTPDVIAKARAAGINSNIWTVNQAFSMRWLKNVAKVDGIMTDNPELLAEVLAAE